ncbi:MAG: PAS domain-containing protein [Cyclobacteriaceae bacterium]
MSQAEKTSRPSGDHDIFSGGGEMGALMQAYDWNTHPLGDPTHWPQSLKTSLQIILHSGYPMFIWWSESFYMFHNDAYLPALGSKHPRALGARARDMWQEIWDQLGSVAEGILQGKEQFYAEDLLILLDRKGFLEETYWTFSYSPILDNDGSIGGVFCACNEVTHKVVSQRRLKALKGISDTATSENTVYRQISDILAENSHDIPFSLMYLLDTETTLARLATQTGHLPSSLAPTTLDIASHSGTTPWPLSQTQQKKQSTHINDLAIQYSLPDHSEKFTVTKAVVFPLLKPDEKQVHGFLILGIGPQLEYDTDYQNFHELLANQVTTTLAQVQARREAKQQQATLLDLFAQAPVAIAILRAPNYVVEVANTEGAKVWGFNLKEALGKSLFDIFPEAKGQGFEGLLDNVVRTGEPFVGRELPVTLNREGKAVTEYFNFVYHPWQENGQVTGVIAVATNVSEPVAARQEIEQKNKELLLTNTELTQTLREKYQRTALLENSSDFIGMSNIDGEIIYLNPAAMDMVGLDREHPLSELKGMDFFFQEDAAFVQDTIFPVTRKKGKWVGEFRFRHFQTGEAIPILYNTFMVKDPASGDLLGRATITIDITERKKREAELQQYQEKLAVTNEELATTNEELLASNEEMFETNEQLSRVNADLDNFVYMASHDLKTPIDNIEGLINTLERYLSPETLQASMVQRLLSLMAASIERFNNTLTDLAQIARLQREIAEDIAELSIGKVLNEVQLDLARMIEETDAQLSIYVSACSPIRFSAKNMRSIIYNLLSNAIKYRSPARRPLVQIHCKENPVYQIFTITDNGLGIDMSEEHKLFSMFQRLHDHVDGTGLGLYIIKKIIESSGGKIEVESQVGVGSTFTVYFKR